MSTALKSTINAIPFTDPAAGGNDNLFLALGKGGIGTVEGGMMVQKPSVLAAQKALKEKQDKEQEQRESGDVTPPEAIETELDLEKLLALLAQQQLNIVELDEFMAGLPDSLQRARSRREVQIAVQAMMIMQMMAHLHLQRYPQSVPPPQIAAIQQLIQQLTTLAKQPVIAPDAVKNLPQLAAAAQLKESLQKAGIAPSPLAFAQMAAKQIGPALDKVLQNLQARVMEGNLSPTSAKQLQALIINLQQARMQMAVMMALNPKAPPSQNLQTLMNKLQQQNITLPPQMLRTLQQALASPANRALNMQALNLMVSRNLANMVGIRNQIMTAQAQMPPSLRQLMAANARDIYRASRVTLPQTIIASFANLRFAPLKPGSVQMVIPQNQVQLEGRIVSNISAPTPIPAIKTTESRPEPPRTWTYPIGDARPVPPTPQQSPPLPGLGDVINSSGQSVQSLPLPPTNTGTNPYVVPVVPSPIITSQPYNSSPHTQPIYSTGQNNNSGAVLNETGINDSTSLPSGNNVSTGTPKTSPAQTMVTTIETVQSADVQRLFQAALDQSKNPTDQSSPQLLIIEDDGKGNKTSLEAVNTNVDKAALASLKQAVADMPDFGNMSTADLQKATQELEEQLKDKKRGGGIENCPVLGGKATKGTDTKVLEKLGTQER